MNQWTNSSSVNFSIVCPSCESHNISSSSEVEYFQYGDHEKAPTLSATIHVYRCGSCDFSFTAEDASELKHDAVCRYLGVFTPSEVRRVRERYSLSQAEFAELSKIGKASLARWESGVLIQNQANDNLLYLLSFSDNFERLKNRTSLRKESPEPSVTYVIPFRAKFRALPANEMENLQRQSERFDLYLSATV